MAAEPVVVVIAADPRRTGRAFEGMRIAAGIVGSETPVAVVLRGPAAHLLDADTEDLVDGDEVATVRDALRRLGVPFHVEAGAIPRAPGWNDAAHPVVPVGEDEIAALVARARRLLAF